MRSKHINANTDPRWVLRNQHRGTVKYKTEIVNDLLINISTNDITELNDLIYAGAKSVKEKSRSPQKPQTESKNLGGNSDLNHRKKKYDKQVY